MTRVRGVSIARFAAAPGLLAALTAACFIFGRNKPDRPAEFDVLAGEIALNITNHNYLDVVIYVLHGGQQTRVGMVTGSSASTIFVPVRLLGISHELQLYGRAIGSEAYARTPILTIQPGQYIEWTLETDLRRSSVGVF